MQFSLISVLAALFIASTLAAPVSETRDLVDPECQGKAIGDACSTFSTVIGTRTGTCQHPSDSGVEDTFQTFCDTFNINDFL
ncbi:hypothetical protein DFH08DRAFT_1087081 [Mycena albidolilacea]|uniref:Uncharacterized protein n=1 Tax=Mycena albidolilacea TaxID=1033008 RepID=A0AAD6ZBV4_9AGAR|nr:hypothetical protein DFH08DRAFT_1087081 [Mycena albidolilacea]